MCLHHAAYRTMFHTTRSTIIPSRKDDALIVNQHATNLLIKAGATLGHGSGNIHEVFIFR